jgi:hypothetical protein
MISEPNAHNNRSETRSRSFLKGRVVFNRGQSSIDCVIRDISDEGAKLEVSGVTLPAFFDLEIPHRGETRRAGLRWSRDGLVGVQFAKPESAQAPVSHSQTSRIGELEAENQRLRKVINLMRAELETLRGERPDRAAC